MAHKINKRDRDRVGESIRAEFDRRREDPKRITLERHWKEIDRQVAMEPKVRVNRQKGDERGAWMSEIELPDQASWLKIMRAELAKWTAAQGDELKPHRDPYLRSTPLPEFGRRGKPPGRKKKRPAKSLGAGNAQ